uniref:Uncharacterized protein n=1 Tax=Oryza sativa subsp. japonica TaxID=39947 RepID=Q75GT8_ORYSJ|nr:hypothetical protein [Oryza sativa Japonica Group]
MELQLTPAQVPPHGSADFAPQPNASSARVDLAIACMAAASEGSVGNGRAAKAPPPPVSMTIAMSTAAIDILQYRSIFIVHVCARPTPPSLPQSPRLLRIRATARLSRIGRCSREARSPRQITAPSTRIPRLRVAGLHSRRPRSARVAGPHHRRRRPRSPSICTAPDEFNPCTALLECECKNGAAAENTLLRAGYGGWLLYSAASAGDMAFVQELMDRDPLLVFGEGEYGVTDMFYAAARGGNAEVFKLLLDHAMSPRAVHAAARGGNVEMLRELIERRSDVSEYLDFRGSTVLHAVAAVEFLLDNCGRSGKMAHEGQRRLEIDDEEAVSGISPP